MVAALFALGCVGLAAIGVLGILDQRLPQAAAARPNSAGRVTVIHGRHRR